MSNPFFSIIIPSYNQGEFLEDCITSIIKQDFKDFEIILMDGGSTDQSSTIIEKYKRLFSYYQSCNDNGQSDAISKGFSKANGRYLMWLNSDDILLPNALSSYYEVLSRHKRIHFLYSNMFLLSPAGHRIGRRILTPLPPLFTRLSINTGLFGFYQPATVWSSSVYDLIGGINPNLRFAMDNDLFIRIIRSVKLDSIYFLDAYTAGFRVHSAQKTSNISLIGSEERSKMLNKLAIPCWYLLHLWVRAWRFLCYLSRGQAFVFFGSRVLSTYKQIP